MTRAALAAAALLALALPSFAQAPAPAASDTLAQPSEAEQLLFMKPQLAGITTPRAVVYDYVASATGQPAASDHATLTMKPDAAGHCCGTHVDFLSGTSAIALPDLDQPQGNPVLMYFLESEVRLLEHQTHGQSSHFRRRIRQSLADDATVASTTVHWNGQDVPARTVHIAPFLTDPFRPRFERESAMTYDFVLSDAVPGGFVRLSATLPGAKPGDPPQAARSLALADPQPAAPANR